MPAGPVTGTLTARHLRRTGGRRSLSHGTGSSTGSTATLECGVRGDRGGSGRRRAAQRPRALAPPAPAAIFSAGHFWADDCEPAPVSKGKLTGQPGPRTRLQVQRPQEEEVNLLQLLDCYYRTPTARCQRILLSCPTTARLRSTVRSLIRAY